MERTGLWVIRASLISSAFQEETALRLEACDFVDIGRAILADPNFGYHAARDVGFTPSDTPLEKLYALRLYA